MAVDLTRWTRELKHGALVNSFVSETFSAQAVASCCQATRYVWRQSFWSPTVTLITFLLQVLSAEKTLRAAVSSLFTQLAAGGETDLPSPDPTAYCQARRRLPSALFAGMLGHVTARMKELPATQQTWRGHRVRIVDGACVSMPDEPALQKAFPQPEAQKPGRPSDSPGLSCGFPVARLVVLFCWATGALLDVVIGSLHPHEITLFRKLWHHFQPGAVVLNDRAYCSCVDIVRRLQRGVFCISRLHPRRKADFRSGTRLGRDDQLVT